MQDLNVSFEMMYARRNDSIRAFNAADRCGVVRTRANDDAARKTARWLLAHKHLAPAPMPSPAPVPGAVQRQ